MTAADDTAVRHTISADVPQDTAFAAFTDGLDKWWRGHKIGPEALERAVLEGHEGAVVRA